MIGNFITRKCSKDMYSGMVSAILLSILLLVLPAGCNILEEEIPDETTVSPHGGPLVMAHYMPWYRGPSKKSEENNLSAYGGHWTRWGDKNPTQVVNGKAVIHARQYPLTGPYHSGNTALLEYQVSLMKIAGIDGVIFDWYGSYDAPGFDFWENHGYTTAMVSVLKKAGLKFLVCYEDNTLNMIAEKNGEVSAPVTGESLFIGNVSFEWAQASWFRTEEYVRFENRPVVLCFGPQHFKTKADWDEVFSGVDPKPYFVDLENKYAWADASFNWFNMPKSGEMTPALVNYNLNYFYNSVQIIKPCRIATVFSAFEDDYRPGEGYGVLLYDDGAVFDLTWKKIQETNFNPAIIQIATWNDYGEGTIIEPTMERGYNELEYIQDRIKEWDPGFPFTKEDLRWPLEFYKLRYTQTASNAQETAIKAATNAIFTGNAPVFRARAAETGLSVSASELKPLLRN